MKHLHSSLLGLALLLPLAATAADKPQGIAAEVQADLAEARRDVRAEMAKARRELDTGDLSLGTSLSLGKRSATQRANPDLPAAHITATGELVIDNVPVALTPAERQLALAYRKQVIAVAKAGIDAGEKAAEAALQATDVSLLSLITSAMTGSLERRIETTVKQHIAPVVQQICQRLPQVLASQQALSSSVPSFRPYANLDPQDVASCEGDMARELAMR